MSHLGNHDGGFWHYSDIRLAAREIRLVLLSGHAVAGARGRTTPTNR